MGRSRERLSKTFMQAALGTLPIDSDIEQPEPTHETCPLCRSASGLSRHQVLFQDFLEVYYRWPIRACLGCGRDLVAGSPPCPCGCPHETPVSDECPLCDDEQVVSADVIVEMTLLWQCDPTYGQR